MYRRHNPDNKTSERSKGLSTVPCLLRSAMVDCQWSHTPDTYELNTQRLERAKKTQVGLVHHLQI